MNDTSIMVLIGFIGGLIAVITPIIKLNNSITKLDVTLKNINETVNKNDKKTEDHEIRIVKLEERSSSH